jgi:hypothetical protein
MKRNMGRTFANSIPHHYFLLEGMNPLNDSVSREECLQCWKGLEAHWVSWLSHQEVFGELLWLKSGLPKGGVFMKAC